MVANSKHTRSYKAPLKADVLETVPAPAKVRAMAAEIRKSWTPQERRRRAVACATVWRQLIGDGD
jgi:hypothetical protein